MTSSRTFKLLLLTLLLAAPLLAPAGDGGHHGFTSYAYAAGAGTDPASQPTLEPSPDAAPAAIPLSKRVTDYEISGGPQRTHADGHRDGDMEKSRT